MAPSAPITELLLAWRQGEPAALDELLPLVNEVYPRLVDSSRVQWRDRAHSFALSTWLMRRILIDAARTRHSRKREGVRIPLDDPLNFYEQRSGDLVARDDALSLSEDTALRDWRLANGWLLRELTRSHGG